ncbi:response regulator transcription factor [Zavarzinella formosa]|uniref:response regulator transcription factor n=1 Tax=Zavarzinella formosa TaxID=360055 RepID=UPI0002ECE849|nr:response regulator [Zavarzinella formosa]
MSQQATIFVVDDDEAIRNALLSVGTLLGHPVRTFPSAEAFLEANQQDQPGCLVLDIKMPGMTGLELQRKLLDANCALPVIMISGHADVRIAVETMTLGAVTLLEKPFGLDELLSNVRKAIAKDQENRSQSEESNLAKIRVSALTSKEREVLTLISQGLTNREMADQLGLSIRAVEDRRSRLMKKVQARSINDLVRILLATENPQDS